MHGKESTPRQDNLATLPERKQAEALARANLGLYRPDNLVVSLRRIAQKTDASMWTNRLTQGDDVETAAYFLVLGLYFGFRNQILR
ncbi:MAG: hypothetical protein AAB553_02430 [Patescibacteria group bacterium]